MAQRASGVHLMTFEEAARLDPYEHPGEVDHGQWKPMTRGTWRHGRIVANVGFLLKLHARKHPGWSIAVADPGTKLARDPDVLRGPDVGMIRAEREPAGKGVDGWLDGAPDIAVEVIGDSQSASELTSKALEYLGAGAKMVWVLDPEPRRVMLFTPPDRVRILSEQDTLDGADALPGFLCKVAELFE